MLTLDFDRGSLLLQTSGGTDDELASELAIPALRLDLRFDTRVGRWRAPARSYRQLLAALHRSGLDYVDNARGYSELDLSCRLAREPYPHQAEAVDAWWRAGRRGVVVLPTGSGKTYVAQLVLERIGRSALVVTPTIDLMNQWYSVLTTSFEPEIGLIGGGYYEPRDLTVTTYDSAYLHMDRLGDRFGVLIFDECHHLPGPSYALAAEASIAPFRLGLTATPEREDGGEARLDDLIGPIIYRREIKELAGQYLADYETVELRVRLAPEERDEYIEERARYRDFVTSNNLRLGSPGGWARFLAETNKSPEGRRALMAFRRQKTIAQASGAKIRLLERLIQQHRQDRVLIFTNDNETVYRISKQFLIPAITHQTKVKERREILQRFNDGDWPFLVTSKVLNEGVDVPAANVAIVLSGSGTVREHVQRLGRILRRHASKQGETGALLYEVIAEETAEEATSNRRRQHDAYR